MRSDILGGYRNGQTGQGKVFSGRSVFFVLEQTENAIVISTAIWYDKNERLAITLCINLNH